MEIREMDNNTLFREYVLTDRELKTLASHKKQIEKEINQRYDDGNLTSKKGGQYEI